MKAARQVLVGFILAFVFAGFPFGASADGSCDRPGTPLEAKALAETAAAHLADVGMGKAFNDFMHPQGGYMPFDLYVFVIDRKGLMWVNGRFPGMMGSSIGGASGGSGGQNIMQDAMKRADEDGSAWVEYNWYNPCTGEQMPKSTFMLKAGEFFIGVGAYGRLSV